MTFKKHVDNTIDAVIDTFLYNHNFKTLPLDIGKIFIIGSGSSYSQALYLGQLINSYLPFSVVVDNPYSFVQHSNISKHDVCIHFSQEFKRNDNVCPITFAKKMGMKTILFSASKPKEKYKNMIDEWYWFAPETEKILVASMSYLSGYASALKYVNHQLKQINKEIIYDINEIKTVMQKAQNETFNIQDVFNVFLYAGKYAQSIAVEGALKVNECLLQDAEAYELKHYSHGKHFVSYNHDRVFNIISSDKNSDLIDLYHDTIFEKHHNINIMKSNLSEEVAVFEWGILMLNYIVQSMDKKKIQLSGIPIRDKIRTPHNFTY